MAYISIEQHNVLDKLNWIEGSQSQKNKMCFARVGILYGFRDVRRLVFPSCVSDWPVMLWAFRQEWPIIKVGRMLSGGGRRIATPGLLKAFFAFTSIDLANLFTFFLSCCSWVTDTWLSVRWSERAASKGQWEALHALKYHVLWSFIPALIWENCLGQTKLLTGFR